MEMAILTFSRHLEMTARLRWYENNGSEVFTAHTIIIFPIGSFDSVYAADVDGDRDVDVVFAHTSSTSLAQE